MRLNHWSTVTAAGLIASLAMLTTACTQPDGDGPSPTPSRSATIEPPTPSASPTPTVDPEVAEAEAAILEAYRGYWAAKVSILADPSLEPGTALETYAVDTALTDVYSTVLSFRSDGIIMVGQPVLDPQVTDIVPGTEGTAAITDCVDVADWQPVFRDSGASAAAPGQATRVSATATAYFYMDRWTIRTYVVDRETPC